MAIQTENQTIQVSTNSTQLSVDSDSNASATVIKGEDLDALSDDPDELSAELSALAGPAAGPNGGQIYIDGFTGGQLPPKSSIREIRINQNPFSAQYDRLGFGRVEIFTKPGTDKFHGSAQMQGNSLGIQYRQPVCHAISLRTTPSFSWETLPGPINSKASFTLSVVRTAIFRTTTSSMPASMQTPQRRRVLCQPGRSYLRARTQYASCGVPPSDGWDISPRFDLALTDKNTLTTRLQYEENTSPPIRRRYHSSSDRLHSTSSEPTRADQRHADRQLAGHQRDAFRVSARIKRLRRRTAQLRR